MSEASRLPDHLRLWAKTARTGDQLVRHPLGYHLLDVAAVAEGLILTDDRRFGSHARDLGVEKSALERLTVFLVALHDLGKASRSFQAKAPVFWNAEIFGPLLEPPPNQPHGELTGWYCLEGPLTEFLEELTPGWGNTYRSWLVEAVAGHHGRPVRTMSCVDTGTIIGREILPIAEALTREIAATLKVEPVELGDIAETAVAAYCWYLATLLPLADWLGSTRQWFPPKPAAALLAEYLAECARPAARKSIPESGIGPVRISSPQTARILPPGATPSPIQAWASAVKLPSPGPLLAIVEDATGSGKTEAALMLAHRIMHAQHSTGFYLALPTMATSNAMYMRLSPIYVRLFEPGQRPSLALAHGHASRYPTFLRSIEQTNEVRLGIVDGDETPVSAFCSGWIADDRRLAFLAQAGAGTIDQAILAVLPSRYQTLRLRGLADKVLIIDEAHAFDSYLSREVEALLAFHASQGGSAIVLSATLPLVTRRRLLHAFAEGAEWPTPNPRAVAYPLATTITRHGMTENALEARPNTFRRVRIERLPELAEGESRALELAQKGSAVALIRSTVDAAIASFERLRHVSENVDVDLFHARFLLADRLSIEQRVISRFGKMAPADERRGRILVATQVIEQSLDIDFDAMISDLAPIDLLVQRAGRLWRHRERDDQRPISEPVLHVISPDPQENDEPSWLDENSIEARWVYKDPALLWQSAQIAFDAGAIVTGSTLVEEEEDPCHIRCLIQRVYGEFSETLPETLAAASAKAEDKRLGHRALAGYMVLNPHKPYCRAGEPWEDDPAVSTRLDDGSRSVRVVLEEGDHLIPFSRGLEEHPDWIMSELRLRPRMAVGLTAPDDEDWQRLAPAWAAADRSILLLKLRRDSSGAAVGIGSDGTTVFRYDPVIGLQRVRPLE